MSYHYSRDPEENLPDWLRELRRRQQEQQEAEAASEAAEESPALPPEETPDSEPEPPRSQGEQLPASTEADAQPAAEPDWLREIRRRHQREADGPPARQKPAVPPKDQIPAEEFKPAAEVEEPAEEPALGDTQPLSVQSEAVEDQAEEEPGEEPEEAPAPDWIDFPAPSPEPEDDTTIEEEGPPDEMEPEPELPDWLAEDADDWSEEADEEPAEGLRYADETPVGLPEPDEPQSEDGAPEDTQAQSDDWWIEDSEEAPPAEGLDSKPDDRAVEPDDAQFSEEQWLGFEDEGQDLDAGSQRKAAAVSDESDLPDWLMEGDPDGGFGHTPAFPGEQESDLSPGELPSWLQALRPPSAAAEEVQAISSRDLLPDQREESVGPLAGLSGVLPAEPEVVRIGKARMPSGRLQVSEGQARHAATLERLIAEEGRPQEDYSRQVALPSRILNLVIAGFMLLATLIPVFTGSQTASVPQAEAYPAAAPLFNQIELLPSDAPVLVAFDVEPGLYGELQAPASQVLRHLLERRARLVFVSTQPTGPALAERLLAEQLGDDPNVATGNYINLGYLSGGMAALRAFAEDPRGATELPSLPNNPWDEAALQAINRLDDFGLVLVISSETEESRAWIEQTAPSLESGLSMVTSAQVAPLMQPYLDSHPQTLRALVAGLSGAAHYEVLQGRSGTGRAAWDAYSYALGASILAIVLGGLYNRLIHLRPEPQDEEPDA